jgi:hypothetical protein
MAIAGYPFAGVISPTAYQPAPLPAPAPTAAPSSAGLDPQKFEQLLFGLPIPVFLGGKALMGCRIIEGPNFARTADKPPINLVSFIAAACIAGVPSGERAIWAMRFNGDVVWNSTDGTTLTPPYPDITRSTVYAVGDKRRVQFGSSGTAADYSAIYFVITAVTGDATSASSAPSYNHTIAGTTTDGNVTWTTHSLPIDAPPWTALNFRTGTEDQLPFDSSVATFGAAAIPYRPLVLVEIINLRLDIYNNEIPFVSLFIGDFSFGDPDEGIDNVDALNAGAALAGLDTTSEFATANISGREVAHIIEKQQTMIEWLANWRKVHPDWNILNNDKLRVIQKSTLGAPDITLTPDLVLANGDKPIAYLHQDAMTVPREKNYRFIDPTRDFEPSVVTARREINPISSTASANAELIDLPIVSFPPDAVDLVNKALYAEELAREQGAFIGVVDLIGAEPGDVISYYSGFRIATHRATAVHGNADWGTEFTTEAFFTYVCPVTSAATTGATPGGTPPTDDVWASWS